MNKYISPEIKIEEIESADVLLASGGVSIGELEGYDTEGTKSAIFDAEFWFKKND